MAEVIAQPVPDSQSDSLTDNQGEPTQQQSEEAANRASKNIENLKKHAAVYGIAAVASLILFGAAHTWATSSGWPVALVAGVAAAFIASMVLSSIFHEWGHYAGAALSGSSIKIADQPSGYFFFLGFNPKANSTRQALWMTWGGLSGSWLLVLAVVLLIPMDSWISAVLLATAIGRAVNASIFEMPIAWRTHQGHDFKETLNARLASPGTVNAPGLIVGLALVALF
jgi:hypothetical protein